MAIDREHLDRMTSGDRSYAIPPFCSGCGYDLTGAVSPQCPECGEVFVRKEWRLKAAQLKHQVYEIKVACEWVHYGFKASVAGFVMVVACLLFSLGWIEPGIRWMAGVCGFSGTFLGLSIFRVDRLPPWARGRVAGISPEYGLAVATLITGVLTLVLVILNPQ